METKGNAFRGDEAGGVRVGGQGRVSAHLGHLVVGLIVDQGERGAFYENRTHLGLDTNTPVEWPF